MRFDALYFDFICKAHLSSPIACRRKSSSPFPPHPLSCLVIRTTWVEIRRVLSIFSIGLSLVSQMSALALNAEQSLALLSYLSSDNPCDGSICGVGHTGACRLCPSAASLIDVINRQHGLVPRSQSCR